MSESLKSCFELIGNKINKLVIENQMFDFEAHGNVGEINLSSNCNTSIEGDIFLGIVTLDVFVNLTDKEEKKCKIELEVEGAFSAPKDEVGQKKFEEMLKNNGVSTLYSIARSIILSISAQVGTQGRVCLPMLNVQAYNNQQK